MEIRPRILKIDLPRSQSAFLWGPRKTGKTTYLKKRYPESLYFDLLQTDLVLDLAKRPSLFRERLLAKDLAQIKSPVILDEVQKVPALLDEVHWLIENKGLSFILCGSSARKLKRSKANLLGGRAWRFEMLPLVSAEMDKLDLLPALKRGLIPDHYFKDGYQQSLNAYLQDYLKEEIMAEGLTRNVPAFARFFDAVGYSHAQIINFSNIARDAGVDSKTVKEYFQILVDTLLGRWVEPYTKRASRQIISRAPKFYLFDVGVANAIVKQLITEERGEGFGRALEHFIFMEIYAYSSYMGLNFPIRFWRTKSGLEVDFILGDGEIAVEVKGTGRIDRRDLRSLSAFQEGYSPKNLFIVCNEKEERLTSRVRIYPWRRFLEALWAGKIIR